MVVESKTLMICMLFISISGFKFFLPQEQPSLTPRQQQLSIMKMRIKELEMRQKREECDGSLAESVQLTSQIRNLNAKMNWVSCMNNEDDLRSYLNRNKEKFGSKETPPLADCKEQMNSTILSQENLETIGKIFGQAGESSTLEVGEKDPMKLSKSDESDSSSSSSSSSSSDSDSNSDCEENCDPPLCSKLATNDANHLLENAQSFVSIKEGSNPSFPDNSSSSDESHSANCNMVSNNQNRIPVDSLDCNQSYKAPISHKSQMELDPKVDQTVNVIANDTCLMETVSIDHVTSSNDTKNNSDFYSLEYTGDTQLVEDGRFSMVSQNAKVCPKKDLGDQEYISSSDIQSDVNPFNQDDSYSRPSESSDSDSDSESTPDPNAATQEVEHCPKDSSTESADRFSQNINSPVLKSPVRSADKLSPPVSHEPANHHLLLDSQRNNLPNVQINPVKVPDNLTRSLPNNSRSSSSNSVLIEGSKYQSLPSSVGHLFNSFSVLPSSSKKIARMDLSSKLNSYGNSEKNLRAVPEFNRQNLAMMKMELSKKR